MNSPDNLLKDNVLIEIRALRELVSEWRKSDQRALELQAKANEAQLSTIRVEYAALSRLVYVGLGIAITVNFFADIAIAIYIGIRK